MGTTFHPGSEFSAMESSSMRATTGNSNVLATDSGGSTGKVEMHPAFAQRSGSGCPWFGQHGCADAIGIETIAAQVADADRDASIKARARILCGSPDIPFAVPSIAT